MELTRKAKIWIGIGTVTTIFLPLILVIGLIAVMFLPMFSIMSQDIGGVLTSFAMTFGLFFILVPVLFILASLTIGLQIFYIIHVLKNEQIEDTIRLIAGLGLLFLPFIAQPVYYFLFIWPDTPPASMRKATSDWQQSYK